MLFIGKDIDLLEYFYRKIFCFVFYMRNVNSSCTNGGGGGEREGGGWDDHHPKAFCLNSA